MHVCCLSLIKYQYQYFFSVKHRCCQKQYHIAHHRRLLIDGVINGVAIYGALQQVTVPLKLPHAYICTPP